MRKLLLTTAFGVLGLPAMAADLAPIYKAPAPVPVCLWCGFYVGLNAGGTWGDDNSVAVNSGLVQDFVPGPASYGAASVAGASGSVPSGNHSGFIGGGQIGYNWQLSSAWLVGFEDDIQGVSGNGNGTLGNSTPVGAGTFFGNPDVVTTSIASTNKLDYLGTVRGGSAICLPRPFWCMARAVLLMVASKRARRLRNPTTTVPLPPSHVSSPPPRREVLFLRRAPDGRLVQVWNGCLPGSGARRSSIFITTWAA